MQSQHQDVRTNERFRIGVGLCTDIGHCTTQMDSTKYFLTHFTSQVCNYFDAFLGYFWNSSIPKHDEIAWQQKVKNMIFCLCIVWKKWDFDQSTTEQRASKT